MSKHTPGPWRFVADYVNDKEETSAVPYDYQGPGYCGNPRIVGLNGAEVVGCGEYYVFNGAADVALLCAAPELLDTVKALVDTHDCSDFATPPCEHCDAALALIRRIEGVK